LIEKNTTILISTMSEYEAFIVEFDSKGIKWSGSKLTDRTTMVFNLIADLLEANRKVMLTILENKKIMWSSDGEQIYKHALALNKYTKYTLANKTIII